MELRHLRYFIAVAEQLHFGQAAEMLGIAPPTLTVQIQQIERTLDAQLFTRTKRSVALTQAGEAFLVEARAALEQFERAVNIGRRAGRGELGRVKLGFVGSAAFSGVLQQQGRAFREARVSETVAFFGSARLRADGPNGRYVDEATELARRVTEWSLSLPQNGHRLVVCSGGGPSFPAANTTTFRIHRFSSHSANDVVPSVSTAGESASSNTAESGARLCAGSMRQIAIASSASTTITDSQL